MYQFFVLLSGVVIAAMVLLNGELTAKYGVFPATAIVHAAGTLLAAVLCARQKRKKPLWGHRPWWIYLGGAVGVLTTVFNAMAYGKLSITSIVALGLLGQTAASLLIDCLGLPGKEKRPFKKSSIWTLVFAAAGIAMMLDGSVSGAAAAVIVSIGAGATVVASRTINARLADMIGPLRGSLVNHITGLGITALLAAAAVAVNGPPAPGPGALRPWIYCGGMLGVVCVLLCNITVPQVPAVRLTMLTFSAQIFTGILLDLMSGRGYSNASFYGGVMVAAGVMVSIVLEKAEETKERKRREYFARIKKAEDEHRKYILLRHGGSAELSETGDR